MPRGTRRIVAIDYDASIGQRMRSSFQEPEYELHWFADGREALGRLPEIRPDVIVCELMLPGLDGRAVLDSVRRSPALRNVPFLVLSSVRSEATIRATLDAGAQAFLVKPCPVSQLKRTIHQVLEEAPSPQAEPGDAPRRQAEGLRLIPTGSPSDADAFEPGSQDRTDAPIVSEGRISTVELDGRSFHVQTVAEGSSQDVVITTTVVSEGQELRRAVSRLACDDPRQLRELLDAQQARALEAIRRLQAEGRLAPLDTRPAPMAPEAPKESGAPAASPAATLVAPQPVPAPPLDVPGRAPRGKATPRRPAPPVPVASDTVVLRPVKGEGPAPPGAESFTPRQDHPPAPLALDSVLLRTRETPRSAPEREILTELWPPPRRGIPWRYLPRAAAALLGLGVLAIILEGPSDTDAPESASALSPEPGAPSEPSPSPVPDSTLLSEPSVTPLAVETPPAAATPPTPAPTAAPATAAPVPSATSAPRAAASTPPPSPRGAAAAKSPPPSAEPAPARQARERTDQIVRGRLQWAQALYDKGRFDEARAALGEVFKLAPTHAQARQLAAQLERSVAGMALSTVSDGVPEEDHRAVLTLLGRYETALEHADITSLQAVWPTVDPQEVRERWRSLRSWQLGLRLVDLEVTADAAVALCVSYDDMWTTEGGHIENSARASFHLRRENGAWIIESVK